MRSIASHFVLFGTICTTMSIFIISVSVIYICLWRDVVQPQYTHNIPSFYTHSIAPHFVLLDTVWCTTILMLILPYNVIWNCLWRDVVHPQRFIPIVYHHFRHIILLHILRYWHSQLHNNVDAHYFFQWYMYK